jgi:hypothetical protein
VAALQEAWKLGFFVKYGDHITEDRARWSCKKHGNDEKRERERDQYTSIYYLERNKTIVLDSSGGRYSDWLRAGRPSGRNSRPSRGKISPLHVIQAGYGAT